MLHEKFIEFSSVNNLSYQASFINRFSISKRIRKPMHTTFHKSSTLSRLLTSERWCVLSLFSCFIHAHNGSADQWSRINHHFWHRREECEGAGLRSLAITTCWNPTIIEIYRTAPHRAQTATQLNHVHWQSSARESTTQRMASGMHEWTMKPLNLSLQRSSNESLNFQQRVIMTLGRGLGRV